MIPSWSQDEDVALCYAMIALIRDVVMWRHNYVIAEWRCVLLTLVYM